MLIVIDNYDSFAHNLARYLRQLSQTTHVVRNDRVTVRQIRELDAQAIVISPGPGTPATAGNCLSIVRDMMGELPILGVCLGHQAIAAAWGAKIVRATQPMHGRASWIEHTGRGLFQRLPSPCRVGRYHSLVVDPVSLPVEFSATAWCDGDTLMAFEHRELPVYGLQFHPESVLTQYGYELLAAFLRRAGLSVPAVLPHEAMAADPDPDWYTTSTRVDYP